MSEPELATPDEAGAAGALDADDDVNGFRIGLSALLMCGILNSGGGLLAATPFCIGGMSLTFMVTFWGIVSVWE